MRQQRAVPVLGPLRDRRGKHHDENGRDAEGSIGAYEDQGDLQIVVPEGQPQQP
jgi:hypothetical protein